MKTNRRTLVRNAAGLGALSILAPRAANAASPDVAALDEAAARPVLDTSAFNQPIVIETLELLKKGKEHFVRVRSKDGMEGVSVDNGRAALLYPIINRLVIPFFVGKDARKLEDLLFGVYRENDNYKL